MISCSENPPEIRRARPLLGTFVEMVVPAFSGAEAQIDRAFAAIAKVQALMSAHDESSDLGRLYAAIPGTPIEVHPWTWRVLGTAKKFFRLTGGAFDPVVAARAALMCGRLPSWSRSITRDSGTFSDLTLLSGQRVCLARRLRLDLGGIAKGFAVDQAVRRLKRARVDWGLVIAGGDMRAFGPRSWTIHLRHPGAPGKLMAHRLCNGAVATSAPYFSERVRRGRLTSALMNANTKHFITGATSMSVFAPTCVVADALTKAVLSDAATNALQVCRARALVLQETGSDSHAT